MVEQHDGEIGVSAVRWRPCYRIIPSRFPPVHLFEDVADPADLDAVFEIESLTNDRIREEVGDLSLIPREDRVSGPGSTFIMGSFTHIHPQGGRFTDGTYGAYYAARDRQTAIDETVYHRARFLREMKAPPTEIDMRVLRATMRGEFHDLRGLMDEYADVYDPDDYGRSQQLGARLRSIGSAGILYDSVRRRGGECAAVFRPRCLSNCKQAEHLSYAWDGSRIAFVYEKRIIAS